MAKYAGEVGYVKSVETRPGIFTPSEQVRFMRGDILSQSKRYEGSDKVNDDISLNNRITLLGDRYAFENYMFLKFVTIDGIRWKVSSVEVARPRLILTVGGEYNG
jgi:hypothetical protein